LENIRKSWLGHVKRGTWDPNYSLAADSAEAEEIFTLMLARSRKE
jgi:hypothetical protein